MSTESQYPVFPEGVQLKTNDLEHLRTYARELSEASASGFVPPASVGGGVLSGCTFNQIGNYPSSTWANPTYTLNYNDSTSNYVTTDAGVAVAEDNTLIIIEAGSLVIPNSIFWNQKTPVVTVSGGTTIVTYSSPSNEIWVYVDAVPTTQLKRVDLFGIPRAILVKPTLKLALTSAACVGITKFKLILSTYKVVTASNATTTFTFSRSHITGTAFIPYNTSNPQYSNGMNYYINWARKRESHIGYDGTTKAYTGPLMITESIGDSAITNEKINDLAVTNSKLSVNVDLSSLDNTKMTTGAVKTYNIIADAVRTSHIQNKNVTTAKLEDSISAVTGVTTPKIANRAVTTIKIEDANDLIAETGVTLAKLHTNLIDTAGFAKLFMQSLKERMFYEFGNNTTAATLPGLFSTQGALDCSIYQTPTNTSGIPPIFNNPNVTTATLSPQSVPTVNPYNSTHRCNANVIRLGQYILYIIPSTIPPDNFYSPTYYTQSYITTLGALTTPNQTYSNSNIANCMLVWNPWPTLQETIKLAETGALIWRIMSKSPVSRDTGVEFQFTIFAFAKISDAAYQKHYSTGV